MYSGTVPCKTLNVCAKVSKVKVTLSPLLILDDGSQPFTVGAGCGGGRGVPLVSCGVGCCGGRGVLP